MVHFDYENASKVEVNDECIKCIWLEESRETRFDEENVLYLEDAHKALIEFQNGKKMIIGNSEWSWLHYL